MSRPFKTGLDYFNLDCVVDDKIKIVEAEHKVTGFYVWVKLLQRIYANSYWIDWDKKTIIVFSNEINVDINSVNDVINSCLEWEVFSKRIFDDYSVLTSHGIQKRYFEATKKRKRFEIISEYMLFDFKPAPDQEIINVSINSINDVKSTQSKVKESKPKEKKEESNILKPDSISEQTWSDFLTLRKAKKAPVTKTVLTKIENQANKVGWTMENALIEMISRGWTGFNADWVESKIKKKIYEY